MKKYLLLLSVIILGVSACKKTESFDAAKQAVTDDNAIQAYMTANSIAATKDPSGLYYKIVTEGTGASPNPASNVTVNYTGKLLNGTTFDSGTISNYSLGGLIKGWQLGVPYDKIGGRILLIVPSALGYGNVANGKIPANSVLVFTIDLIGFTN